MDDLRHAYDEVYAYTMRRPGFILQHVVDAFAAQTARQESKQIGIVFSLVGLNQDYVETRGASFFAAECHVLYKRELTANDLVRITAQLIAFDDKRLHFYLEMRHASEGWLAATSENLALHVDLSSRRVTPFPADILANLAIMKAAHARMPRPATVGRMIGMPEKSAITLGAPGEAQEAERETETRH